MTKLVWGIDEAVEHFITAHFPDLTAHSPFRAHKSVGIVNENDELVGGISLRLLNGFDGSISVVSHRSDFILPSMCRDLFHYVFVQERLTRLSCSIAKGNKRARRLAEGLGFKLEGVKRQGFDGRRDACQYGMLATECRWLRKSNA